MSEVSNEHNEKVAFAAHLSRDVNDAFGAALAVFPNNVNKASWCARYWPVDPVVVAEMQRLRSALGGAPRLPGKSDLLKAIWDRMGGTRLPDGRVQMTTPDEFAKLGKLYAEVCGLIEKPQPTVNVSVPRAIEVPVHSSDEAWEQAAQRQQRELLNVSRDRY